MRINRKEYADLLRLGSNMAKEINRKCPKKARDAKKAWIEMLDKKL
jgi:hypothetical protein